jgi:1-acyl-sn-glycerol-3-phosphate acyltransferase
MTGKTGAARVALQTKCPVIPVAQWGCNELLPPYSKKPRLLPRKTHHVLAGPPVDLTRFYDREMTAELLKEATEVIMAAVTRQLEEIRGEQAPETPYDPRRERIEQRRRTKAQTQRGGQQAASPVQSAPAGQSAQSAQEKGLGK